MLFLGRTASGPHRLRMWSFHARKGFNKFFFADAFGCPLSILTLSAAENIHAHIKVCRTIAGNFFFLCDDSPGGGPA